MRERKIVRWVSLRLKNKRAVLKEKRLMNSENERGVVPISSASTVLGENLVENSYNIY